MNAVIWAIVITAWVCALAPPVVRAGRRPLGPPAQRRTEFIDWERKGWA